jgi:hypothetical protein
MPQLQTYIDPESASELFENLSLSVDKPRLLREIETKSENLLKVRQTDKDSEREQFLLREITKLQVQLNYIRDHSNQN